MAKKPVVMPPTQQEDELTVTVFRFRGSSESMQKGFEAFGSALGAALGTATPTARQVNGNSNRKAQAQLAAAAHDVVEPETDEQPDVDAGDAADEQAAEPATPKAPKAPAPRRKYDFISDISENATTPLKEFVAERNPTEVNDKYLVACLWLQTAAGFETFTADHIWTCFQMLEWKKLADFMQPMRFMKSKKNYFDMPKKGDWKLNPHGLEIAQAIKAPTA